MEKVSHITCPGCGLEGEPFEGPVHRYMTSSPYCWNLYGKVLAREYQDPAYMAHHRFTVDAFALQHPGTENEQAAQSVNIHLLSLHLIFAKDMPIPKVMTYMKSLSEANKGQASGFKWLSLPKGRGAITVCDVLQADSADAHGVLVRDWAKALYDAWQEHHSVAERKFQEWVAN